MTEIETQPEYQELLKSARELLKTVDVQLIERPKRQAAFITAMDRIYRHWETLERKVSEAEVRNEDAEAEVDGLRARLEAAEVAHRAEVDAESRRSSLSIAEMQSETEEAMGRMQAAHGDELSKLRTEFATRLAASERGRIAAEGSAAMLHATLAKTVALVESVVASMSEEHVGMSDAVDALRRRVEADTTHGQPRLQIEHRADEGRRGRPN